MWGAAGWESVEPVRAQQLYEELVRKSAAKARAKIVEQLGAAGDLVGEPRAVTHAVKFYEKGDRPLEIVTSRQWFFKTIEFQGRCSRAAASSNGTRRTCGRDTRTGRTASTATGA